MLDAADCDIDSIVERLSIENRGRVDAAVTVQAWTRGRLVRKETSQLLEAAHENRRLELGHAVPVHVASVGAIPCVQTHPLQELCMAAKARVLTRAVQPTLLYQSSTGMQPATSSIPDGYNLLTCCRKVDVLSTEAWLRREAPLEFGLPYLLTLEELQQHYEEHSEDVHGFGRFSTVLLSLERVPVGKLAHVSSCFYPSGVLFYPESKRKMLHMSVTLGRASVTVDIPAAHIFAAFKKACRYKRQLERNLQDVRHRGVSMNGTWLSRHKMQLEDEHLPHNCNMMVLYLCRYPRRGKKDGLRVLGVDMRVTCVTEADEEECAICLEALHRGGIYTCKHCSKAFHANCRKEWIQACGSAPTCPLCRGTWVGV